MYTRLCTYKALKANFRVKLGVGVTGLIDLMQCGYQSTRNSTVLCGSRARLFLNVVVAMTAHEPTMILKGME